MGQPILSHLTYIIRVPMIAGEIGIQRILEKIMATIFPKFTKAKLRDSSCRYNVFINGHWGI